MQCAAYAERCLVCSKPVKTRLRRNSIKRLRVDTNDARNACCVLPSQQKKRQGLFTTKPINKLKCMEPDLDRRKSTKGTPDLIDP